MQHRHTLSGSCQNCHVIQCTRTNINYRKCELNQEDCDFLLQHQCSSVYKRASNVIQNETAMQSNSNNNNNNKQQARHKRRSLSRLVAMLLAAMWLLCFDHHLPTIFANANPFQPAGYQVSGQPGDQVRLPCLIGRQLYCGQPYLIVWYKMNATTKGNWMGILRKSWDELAGDSGKQQQQQQQEMDRVRFVWNWQGVDQPTASVCQRASSSNRLDANNLDCSELVIGRLEPEDEGQYKCEITFTESLDVDKCPPNTLSQLNVITRPNEPELLLNGRTLSSLIPLGGSGQLTFKEGSQVKLECQSSGGRPSPRIEWFNVSGGAIPSSHSTLDTSEPPRSTGPLGPSDVQLMRSQKKSTMAGNSNLRSPNDSQSISSTTSLTSSSSLVVSLSRYDLDSQFVCLVIPQTTIHWDSQQASNEAALMASRSPSYWASLLNQASSNPSSSQSAEDQTKPMSKWIRFNVQVKPTSTSLIVRDLASNTTLNQILWQSGANTNQIQPAGFYSLKLDHLYAIQCIIDNSRPVSRVSWFNKTAPIGLEPVELNGSDFLRPQLTKPHRISSFIRHVSQADGTFRTIASLLLTSNIWDNYEEIFCRVSNEAFQFDELTSQVAPIMSVGLYVNYAPFAWIELEPSSKLTAKDDDNDDYDEQAKTNKAELASSEETRSTTSGAPRAIHIDEGNDLSLRCSVAANPLAQNTILQIEWLKDGAKLETTGSQAGRDTKVTIEKANHLHMPTIANTARQPSGLSMGGDSSSATSLVGPSQLVSSSKLLASSWLTIGSISRPQSGFYSCHFKLIPAPSSTAAQTQQHQHQHQQNPSQPIKITSGQAKQTIQVNVIEAKPKAPILRIQSASGLYIYGTQIINWPPDGLANSGKHNSYKQQTPTQIFTMTVDQGAFVSLKCDLNLPSTSSIAHHKITWLLNGNHLHTSSNLDTFNLSLASTDFDPLKRNLGKISCVHQIVMSANNPIGDSFHANQVRLFPSANEIDLRPRVEPRLILARPELMPPVRSFSQPELNANPGQKLKLACMARCEPICSISWLVNERPIEMSSQLMMAAEPQLASNEPRFNLLETGDKNSVALRSVIDMSSLGDLELGPNRGLTFVRTVSRLANDSTSSWISETSVGPKQSSQKVQLAVGGLRRELDPSNQLKANVFAKLDLTYNQLSQALTREYIDELVIKCQIDQLANKPTNGPNQLARRQSPLKSSFIKPLEWFPSKAASMPLDFENSWTFAHNTINGDQSSPMDNVDNSNIQLNYQNRKQLAVETEMQTRILLDKPPQSVMVAFRATSSSDLNPTTLSILESELLELADPNNGPPLLQCQVGGNPYPPVKYRWTFTDLNKTEQPLNIDGPQLDLRQFIEFRQRQINADPSSAYGIDVVSNLSGNYTCLASNMHGSRAATLSIIIQGRPLCKLNLVGEHLESSDGLLAALRCSVYSSPPLIETIWLRGNREIAINTTNQAQIGASSLNNNINNNNNLGIKDSINFSLSSLGLLVGILNKQHEFLLSDLETSNFKCIARNSLGYSQTCELSPIEKQTLMSPLKPTDRIKSKDLRAFSWLIKDDEPKQAVNLLANNSTLEFGRHQQSQHQVASALSNWLINIVTRPDLIIAAALCSLIAYLIISLGFGFVRRRKLRLGDSLDDKDPSWHFNTNANKLTRSCNRDFMGASFQSTVGISPNYYGDSNGDSEHDMIQSCSQSSHYEEFGGQNPRGQMIVQPQQPLYFNHAPVLNSSATTNRRPIKSSLSVSSTGDSGSTTGSRRGQTQLVRLNEHIRAGQMNSLKEFSNLYNHQVTNGSAKSTGPQMNATHSEVRVPEDNEEGELILVSNQVPLVNTSQASQINLDLKARLPKDQHNSNAYSYRLARNHQTFSNGQHQNKREHIYDDVIYQQMIL